MLKTDNDIDIINELGKVNSETSAKEVFKQYMDDEHLSRISKIKHSEVLKKIADAIVRCNPSKIFINTGSSDDRQFIKNLALAGKEESPLAMDGHTIHYDLAQEQGRVIDRTYYIANP